MKCVIAVCVVMSLVICFYVIRNRDIEELKKSPPRVVSGVKS